MPKNNKTQPIKEIKAQPVGDRILVKTVTEEATKSGIVLPDTVDRKKKAEGEIIDIGNGEKISKFNFQIGQKVLISNYIVQNKVGEIKVQDKIYMIIIFTESFNYSFIVHDLCSRNALF